MKSIIFLGASSKCSTRERLLDASPSWGSTMSTIAWAAATSQTCSLEGPAKGHFGDFANNGQSLSSAVQVLTSLGRSQLLLKLGFLLFKTLDPLFHLINFSRVLPVSFIKLVPSIESLIRMLGDFSILLSQGVPVIHGLIQSMRLQEGPVGNILQTQNMICQRS